MKWLEDAQEQSPGGVATLPSTAGSDRPQDEINDALNETGLSVVLLLMITEDGSREVSTGTQQSHR